MSEVPQVLRDVYIARYAEERIVAGTAVRLNDVDGYFTHPAIAPDAKRAAYWGRCRGRLGLWAADLSVRRVTLLPIGAGMACHPAWSPDARCLAYAE